MLISSLTREVFGQRQQGSWFLYRDGSFEETVFLFIGDLKSFLHSGKIKSNFFNLL
jgi:hypothetical protein